MDTRITYDRNYFDKLKQPLQVEASSPDDDESIPSSSSSTFINLSRIEGITRLPFSHRFILESLIRNENYRDAARILAAAADSVTPSQKASQIEKDAEDAIWNFVAARDALNDGAFAGKNGADFGTNGANAAKNEAKNGANHFEPEICFSPSRVLFQDFSCLSSFLDLASLRDVARDGEVQDDKIHPAVAVDILLDHSMSSDYRKKSCPPSNSNSGHSRPTPASSLSPKPNPPSQPDLPSSSSAPKKYLPPHLRAKISSAQQQQQRPQQQQRRGSQSSSSSPSSSASALSPEDAEWQRNKERLEFVKWCGQAFEGVNVIPPVSGLSHQVFLEYASDLVHSVNGNVFPQTVLGTDTHTALVNGLGILGLTTGSIECESAMFGEGVILPLPRVVGFRLKGGFNDFVTSTDIVIAIVKKMKSESNLVSGKIVEFSGLAVLDLSLEDRMAIAQMSSEAGVQAAFFPPDKKTREYFQNKLDVLRPSSSSSSSSSTPSSFSSSPSSAYSPLNYYTANAVLFQTHNEVSESEHHQQQKPCYDAIIEYDVGEIVSCATGPRGATHRVPLDKVQEDFDACREEIAQRQLTRSLKDAVKHASPVSGVSTTLCDGDVVTADIVDYTNATFPSVLLTSGLLAKKAVEFGLKIPSHVEASLRPPRCRLADLYLRSILPAFHSLGFKSDGNSDTSTAYSSSPASSGCGVVLASVMSSKNAAENKLRANYLVYPPLVVAYALSGKVTQNLNSSPLGQMKAGQDVLLKDLWPSRSEVHKVELSTVKPSVFLTAKSQIATGVEQWSKLEVPKTNHFRWNSKSTYIQRPKYLDRFENRSKESDGTSTFSSSSSLATRLSAKFSSCLALVVVGDSFSADHISLAGSMDRESAAGQHLLSAGVVPRYFYSYGSRSGNDQVMIRGTFAHAKMDNKMTRNKGPTTIHIPTGDELGVFDACDRYNPRHREGINDIPLVVVAGKDFGKGPAREWAVKGPWLMGVRVILAKSFNPVYEKSLVQIGILPLRLAGGENARDLGITGRETFSFEFEEVVVEEDEEETVLNSRPISHHVRVCLDNGKEFKAEMRFHSEETMARVLAEGFFARSTKRLLSGSV